MSYCHEGERLSWTHGIVIGSIYWSLGSWKFLLWLCILTTTDLPYMHNRLHVSIQVLTGSVLTIIGCNDLDGSHICPYQYLLAI